VTNDIPPSLIAAIISAFVSISIVAISRWIFSRADRRFPILVLIQEKLPEVQSNPPWDTNGGNVHFERIQKIAKPLQLYFDRLRMVSCPRKNCAVQKAWHEFRNISEKEWKARHPNRTTNYDSLSKVEFLQEVDKILSAISNG